LHRIGAISEVGQKSENFLSVSGQFVGHPTLRKMTLRKVKLLNFVR